MLILILLLILCQNAWSATVTVATKAALQNAINAAQDGDIIEITNGTYTNWGTVTIPITSDGAENNRITLKAATPYAAIFSGQGALELSVQARYWTISGLRWTGQTSFGALVSNGAGGGSLITLDGAQDVVVEDIQIASVSGPGVPIPIMELIGPRPTRGITLRNIQFDTYNQNQGSAVGIYVYGQADRGYPREVTIEDSTFSNRTVSALVQNNKWMRLGFGKTDYDARIKVRRNTFIRDTPNAPQQDVIAVGASGVEISDNTFKETSGIIFRRGNNGIFTRNKIVNPNPTFTDAAVVIHDGNHIVTNNLCYTVLSSKACFNFGMGNANAGADGVKDWVEFNNSLFAHNTIDGFVERSIDMRATQVGTADGITTVNPSNIRFLNNVIRQTLGTMVDGNDCPNRFSEASNNSWSGAALPGCLTESTNNVIAIPEWISPAASNYRPAKSSPLISAGTQFQCELYTETDIDGLIRDLSPDIGAYESEGVTPESSSCADLFGSAPDYKLCSDDALSCEFSVTLNDTSCNDLCATHGRVCVTSYDNATASCTRGVENTCAITRADQICVCKKNEEAQSPVAGGDRYIDTSCETSGDGTTETCGANGPWNSLQYAMEVADCFGMTAGDIIHMKGNATPQSDGSWYTGEYDQPINLGPDSDCSGVIVQNATGHHVVLDGTLDLSGETWVELGTSNVFECQSSNCGTTDYHPFTAWYKIGSGEEQRLNLVQTRRTCTEDLAAGWMTYNPDTKQVCAHLSDDSSPAAATYFRIPFNQAAIKMEAEDVDGLTFRANPDGTGSFNITRYRDDIITVDPSISQDIIVDGLNLSWARSRGIKTQYANGVANYKFLNNDVSFVGNVGIEWSYDLGQGDVVGNQIHDIGTYPVFEECDSIGDGCYEGSGSATAIRVYNCATPDGQPRGTIQGNGIYNIGGGTIGLGIGIDMHDCTYGNLVDSNLIYDSDAPHYDDQGVGFRGIMFTGVPAGQYHDQNIISNNRCENIEFCFVWDTGTATSQVGKSNYVLGNTCHNPYELCWFQDRGTTVGGNLFFQNNIASIENGYTKLADIPVDTKWDASFTHNAFECSHTDCTDQVVATIQDDNYKLLADCTPATDCFSDLGDNNFDAPMALQCGTMELTEGSNAINRGTNLSRLTTDYLGITRPVGAFTDIGAHEFPGETPSINIVQHGFRFYNTFRDDGEDPLEAENVAPEIYSSGKFTLRFSLAGDNVDTQKATVNLAPYYQHCDPTCGDWFPVTDNCIGEPICFVNNPYRSNEEPITNDLSLDGRTFSTSSKFIDDPRNAIPLIFTSNNQIEAGMGTDMDAGDTISVRVQNADGSELAQYVNTPSIPVTVGKAKIILGY